MARRVPRYRSPVLEFLEMILWVGGALLALAWIGSGQRPKSRRRDDGDRANGEGPVDDMSEIGTAGGLLGGEMDDLFVGRFALRRRRDEE